MVLTGVAVIVVLFSVCSMMVVKAMYDKQFGRADKPKFSGYLTYGDVDGYCDRRVVRFKSGDNTLVGYVYGEHNDKGLVVIAHGLGGGAESYMAETLYFVDNGWRVFSFDCTGSYESEGKGAKGLPQSVVDLNSALGYIESDSALKDLPVMLYGHSWGGYAVAAVLNYGHDVAAAASIAGFNAPMEILFERAERMMGSIAHVAALDAGRGWLAEVLGELDDSRALLARLVADHLPAVSVRVPDATYLAWLDFRATDLGEDPATAVRQRAGVALSSGPHYGAVAGRGFARLNFATGPEILAEAVTRIASVAGSAIG